MDVDMLLGLQRRSSFSSAFKPAAFTTPILRIRQVTVVLVSVMRYCDRMEAILLADSVPYVDHFLDLGFRSLSVPLLGLAREI